jgi:DNA-binding transcriptional LysR family regulator
MGSTEAIKHIVAAGTALGCLPRHAVAQALEDGHRVVLCTQLPPARRRLALAMHRDKRLGATAAAFVKHCGSEIAGSRFAAAPPPHRCSGCSSLAIRPLHRTARSTAIA